MTGLKIPRHISSNFTVTGSDLYSEDDTILLPSGDGEKLQLHPGLGVSSVEGERGPSLGS